ncbi:N-acetylmuramoyl-L-alanine amidase [Pontibacter harenae]|uniref:N-acetylmuramoyl-L-alanine amidase n=1 Tax=Pontibacter harenae TaxID=2894083 RepID=UPI001E53A99E|nr:N-acetylmuramoyl-L-alanine amidase [Pontibacter harenae]MCC9167819.1 N-acetylmuramoyl-L-alanine amidase [Pontibacter harenae]
MKYFAIRLTLFLAAGALVASCSVNPYASTNRSYKKQVKAYTRALRTAPLQEVDTIAYPRGDQWVGTTNFSMRKPNYVIIHHTAQNSTEQTLKTFTTPRTSVSAHYVIGRDGKVYHMLHDYLRAWHAGAGRWGNATDLNSSSVGIELDNNGSEPFTDEMITSLIGVLAKLKKEHGIPAANFIGHSDIAPVRKVDPSPLFPWKKLADNGYGLWYDENVLDSVVVLNKPVLQDSTLNLEAFQVFKKVPVQGPVPEWFNPQEVLRIIGYDTRNMDAAIRAFKIHFVQQDVSPVLTEQDKAILYNLYKKYL